MSHKLSLEAQRKLPKLKERIGQELGKSDPSLSDIILYFYARVNEL